MNKTKIYQIWTKKSTQNYIKNKCLPDPVEMEINQKRGRGGFKIVKEKNNQKKKVTNFFI